MPLPKGTVWVYKADQDGTMQFAGEDRIAHTPRNEKLWLVLWSAYTSSATGGKE